MDINPFNGYPRYYTGIFRYVDKSEEYINKIKPLLDNKEIPPKRILCDTTLDVLELISQYINIDQEYINDAVEKSIICEENPLVFKYCSVDDLYNLQNINYKYLFQNDNIDIKPKDIKKIFSKNISENDKEIIKELVQYTNQKQWKKDLLSYININADS